MRPIFLAIALVLSFTSNAASDTLVATRFSKWIDPGWKLIRIAQGDLNHDGKSDAVLVVQKEDPENIKQNEGLGPPTLDINPRRLLILFKTEVSYEVVARVDHFLPTEGDADATCLNDPLEEGSVGISKGLLKIGLHYWRSCGSYGVSHTVWSFRYETRRFRLVGMENWSFMRNSGERSESSKNFLTGKQKITSGMNEFSKKSKPSIVWKNNPRQRAFFLDEMTSDCYVSGKVQEWCQ